MILAGKSETFAIAAEITGETSGWVLGRFRFIFRGRGCGNWNDEADLRGCHSWLKDFSVNKRNRYEPDLLTLPPIDVFKRLVTPVIVQESVVRIPEVYQDTFSRFHISHLGMSSFDSIIMVLVESPEQQRCLWQCEKNGAIHSEVFSSMHMQQVAGEFCRLFESEIAALGYADRKMRVRGQSVHTNKVSPEPPAPKP